MRFLEQREGEKMQWGIVTGKIVMRKRLSTRTTMIAGTKNWQRSGMMLGFKCWVEVQVCWNQEMCPTHVSLQKTHTRTHMQRERKGTSGQDRQLLPFMKLQSLLLWQTFKNYNHFDCYCSTLPLQMTILVSFQCWWHSDRLLILLNVK